MYRKNNGYTLVELLVAIAIFATLITLVCQALEQVYKVNDMTRLRYQRAIRLQKVVAVLDSDFKQIADQTFRAEGKKIHWGEGLLGGQGNDLIFNRFSWINDQWKFPGSGVTRVGYRLEEGRLERIWGLNLETPVGNAGNSSLLLNRVTDFRASFYFDGKWDTRWSYKSALPQAISIKLETKNLGHIERIYVIPSLNSGKKVDHRKQAGGYSASSSNVDTSNDDFPIRDSVGASTHPV